MVRLTTPVVLTQMNAAALNYDVWLRLLRVELFAGRAWSTFFHMWTPRHHVFSFLFLCILRKRQHKKNITKALAFTRLFPLLIGHFLIPKTHYFQNEAKCKTFHTNSFPLKALYLAFLLNRGLRKLWNGLFVLKIMKINKDCTIVYTGRMRRLFE